MLFDGLGKLLRPGGEGIVLDLQHASVPFPRNEGPVVLGRATSFTPASDKAYELLAELAGNVAPAPLTQPGSRPIARVGLWANGESLPELVISSGYPTDRIATPLGLLQPGKAIAITATSRRSDDVESAQASLRIVVIEFG